MYDGFLNINKPPGFTSHDVVNKVRRIFRTKAVGHMGTLDPEATGVLPIAIGKATRLITFVEGVTKEYVGELVLGTTTDTLDLQGQVLESADVSHITNDMIRETLPHFLGTQAQLPPMYSAIKVGGKKLYEYARAGVSLDVAPRQVEINALELMSIVRNDSRLIATLRINCGKGTYIRSLCRDIGTWLGVPACMGKLVRTASGPFSIGESVTLEQLNEEPAPHVISITQLLKGSASITLEQAEALRFIRGQRLVASEQPLGDCAVFFNTVFLGLGEIKENILSPKKVLAQEGDIQ